MTAPDVVEQARQDFRTRVLEWSAALDDPTMSIDAANAAALTLRGWVRSLDERGISDAVLLPFLTDDSPALRCGAAMFLLRRGHTDEALSVLNALADNDDYGSIASRADAAILGWRQEQRDTTKQDTAPDTTRPGTNDHSATRNSTSQVDN